MSNTENTSESQPSGNSENKGFKPIPLPKSKSVMLIVLFGVIAFAFTSWILNKNIEQYASQPKFIRILVQDGHPNVDQTYFNLPVHSRLAIDSVKKEIRPAQLAPHIFDDVLYHETPIFLVWTILICIMSTTAAASAAFFITKIIELKKDFELPDHKLFWSCIYALILVVFLMISNTKTPGFTQPPDIIDNFHILLKHGYIIQWIVGCTLFLVSPGLAVIFLIASASDRTYISADNDINNPDVETNEESIQAAVKDISYLNKLLQNTLQILASIVVLAVLTTHSLGQAINDTIRVEGFNLYPKQVSYVYGLYFTLFLCIIYIPVYFYLKNNYDNLKELAANQTKQGTLSNWYSALFGQTKFEGSAIDNLKLALTIIAPLLSSLLPGVSDVFK